MKWAFKLNPEQAALVVTGFIGNIKLDELHRKIALGTKELNHLVSGREELYEKLGEACQIASRLESEAEYIMSAQPKKTDTVLEVAVSETQAIFLKFGNWDNTTFTRKSLAKWFYEAGDIDKAKILAPNFTPSNQVNLIESEQFKIKQVGHPKQLKTRTPPLWHEALVEVCSEHERAHGELPNINSVIQAFDDMAGLGHEIVQEVDLTEHAVYFKGTKRAIKKKTIANMLSKITK